MKTNWIALAVSLTITAGISGAFAANTFSDVKSSWAQQDINKVVNHDIMTGYNDGMFHPDAWVSREDFVKMADKTLGLSPDQASIVPSFNSVAQNSWGFGPVDNQAWISSYPTGVAQPENPVRRVEALSALAGALNKPLVSDADANTILSKYQDAALIPVTARRDVATAIHYKIFEVDPKSGSNMIDPLRPATRAEVASLLEDLYTKRDIAIVQNGQMVANATPNGAGVPNPSMISSQAVPGQTPGQTVAGAQQTTTTTQNTTATETSTSTGTNMANQTTTGTGVNTASQTTTGSNLANQTTPSTGDNTANQTTTGTSAVSGSSDTGTTGTTGTTTTNETNTGTTGTTGTTAATGTTTPATDKIGYKHSPYRNSADDIAAFRQVNTSPSPSNLDASVPVTLAPNTTFMGTVAKALYSDFNRPGDPVMLILDHPVLDANGRVIAPAGSKVVGFVNNVVSHNVSKESGQIGITFNGFITPTGQVIPINATIDNTSGLLKAGEAQGIVFSPAGRSVEGLRREINTASGSRYGSIDGKAAVLDQPIVNQVSDIPVDPMDITSKDLLIGVGDRIQLRLDNVGPGTGVDNFKSAPASDTGTTSN